MTKCPDVSYVMAQRAAQNESVDTEKIKRKEKKKKKREDN